MSLLALPPTKTHKNAEKQRLTPGAWGPAWLLLLFHSNRSRLLSLALRLVAVHCTGASRALNHMDKVEFRYE